MAVNCALCSHAAYFKLVDALQAYCIWTIIDPDMICDYSIRNGNDVRLCIGLLSLLGHGPHIIMGKRDGQHMNKALC